MGKGSNLGDGGRREWGVWGVDGKVDILINLIMRYLIIDTSLVEKGTMSEVRLNQLLADNESDIDNIILSEEETEAKLKEIWESGYNSGFDELEYPGVMDKDWQEYKSSL